jgi:hemicentin
MLLFLLSDVFCIVPPVIPVTVTEVAFTRSSSALLPCNAYGIPAPAVHWEHNGEPLFIDGHKYILFPNGTLQIKNVQTDDNGIYHCVASNNAGNVTAEITVDIHLPPSVVAEFKDQLILVNQCVVLQCVGLGNPPPVIIWKRSTKELINSSHVFISSNGTQLTICPVKESDADVYTCLAANDLGQSNFSAKLDVIVKPNILDVDIVGVVSIVTDHNHDAWLPCEATGNPPPEVIWYKDRVQIDNDFTKYHIHANGSLQIRNLEQWDAGVYQCVAVNVGGQHTHNVTLDLHFSPSFITIPVDINLLVESNIVLNCSVFANPAAKLTWYKDGIQIENASNSRISISSDGIQLTISDIQEKDAGNYTCIAENYVNFISASRYLTVIVPSVILSNLGRVDAFLKLSAWLPCETHGIPSPGIQWVRDGQVIGNTSRYIIFANGTLRIDNLESSDHGVYKCIAVNLGGVDANNVTLNVQYGPQLLTVLGDKVVVAHSDVVFYCHAIGNPVPRITWSKEGHLLNSSAERIETTLNGRVLILKDVQPSDSGYYTCTADSTFPNLSPTIIGKVSSTAKLTVIAPPTIIDHQVLVTVHNRKTAWLNCSAFGVPPPTIQWFRDGREIFKSKGYQISSNGTLRIKSVSIDDAGLYKCIATNVAGNTIINTTLNVLYPPFITNISSNQSVVVDESVTLWCIADGNPSPQIEWWFQGHPLRDSVQGISMSNDNTSLTIHTVKPKDLGQYTCMATNPLNEHRGTVNVDIVEPPEILTTESTMTVKLYSDAYLNCVAQGNPSPQLLWLKGGVQVNQADPRFSIFDNGTLRISGVLGGDSGVYQCLAINAGGFARKNTALHVLYPPRIIAGPTDQTKPVGSDVTFNCTVDSSLPYRITWIKNDRIIDSIRDSIEVEPLDDVEQSSIITISPGGAVLTISRVDETASGLYTCLAQNHEGLTKSSGKLYVTGNSDVGV